MRNDLNNSETPVYPAIFHRNEDFDGYEVSFPDLPYVTCGKTIEEAFLMACDVLACSPLTGLFVSAPTPFHEVKTKKGDVVLLVRPAVYQREK